LTNKSSIRLLAQTPIPTEYGGWEYIVFSENGVPNRFHTAVVYGPTAKELKSGRNVLARVHSACATSELFHASNCECREELEEAMRRIRKEGKGVLVYLDQEGAGNGIKAKIQAYGMAFRWKNNKVVPVKNARTGENMSIYEAYRKLGYGMETRSFKVAADILKNLGIRSVRLLTNNPSKVKGLQDEGIKAIPVGLHIKPKNKIVASHLSAKARLLGHKIKE
jgi:3,4-dihydroxy 2-butanone 4-phosphate synthase/GTP cyclohydrolase II